MFSEISNSELIRFVFCQRETHFSDQYKDVIWSQTINSSEQISNASVYIMMLYLKKLVEKDPLKFHRE
jgi:hypothetical protein